MHERAACTLDGDVYVLLGFRSIVGARVVHPPFRLVERLRRVRLDLIALLHDSTEDEQQHDYPEREQHQQHESRARGSWDFPALQRVDERPGDCGGDRSDDDRHEDRRDLGQDPDRPDQQESDANQEPRE